MCWRVQQNWVCFGPGMGEELQIAVTNPSQVGCIYDLMLRELFGNPLKNYMSFNSVYENDTEHFIFYV